MRFVYLNILIFLFAPIFSKAQSYCLPTYNSLCTSGDYINNVTFNTISNLGTGCAYPSSNNYSDYTSISTTLTQNTSYTLTCTPGPTWGQYFVAFIDFNFDNDFADPGEFFNIGYASGGTTINGTISIPNGIANGQTTLRIMCRYSTGSLTQSDVCTSGLSFGEVEDYTVQIIGGVTCMPPVNNMFFGMDGDWSNPTNWSEGCLPQFPLTVTLTIMENVNISSLGAIEIDSNGSIIIESGTTFQVDELTINSGGSMVNNGILHSTSGSITNNGLFKGIGDFTGNFINNGTTSPGN